MDRRSNCVAVPAALLCFLTASLAAAQTSGFAPPNSAAPPAAVPAVAAVSPATPPPPMKGHVDGEDEKLGARTMSGHTFQMPVLIDTPFVSTNFGVGTELGFQSQPGIKIPYQDPETGQPTTFVYDANAGFIRERFSFGVAPIDMLQIHVDADYTALVGANEDTIFIFGGETSYGFRPGVRVRLGRIERSGTQFGIHAYGVIDGGLRIAPVAVLALLSQQLPAFTPGQPGAEKRTACLSQGDLECAFPGVDVLGALQFTRSAYGGGGSLNVAQALGRYLGAQLTAGVEYAPAKTSNAVVGDISSSRMKIYGGIAPGLNLDPKLPVGGMLEYRFDIDRESYPALDVTETNVNHSVAAGLFYTGRRDLQLGWILNGNFYKQSAKEGEKASEQPAAAILTAQFTMRYFF